MMFFSMMPLLGMNSSNDIPHNLGNAKCIADFFASVSSESSSLSKAAKVAAFFQKQIKEIQAKYNGELEKDEKELKKNKLKLIEIDKSIDIENKIVTSIADSMIEKIRKDTEEKIIALYKERDDTLKKTALSFSKKKSEKKEEAEKKIQELQRKYNIKIVEEITQNEVADNSELHTEDEQVEEAKNEIRRIKLILMKEISLLEEQEEQETEKIKYECEERNKQLTNLSIKEGNEVCEIERIEKENIRQEREEERRKTNSAIWNGNSIFAPRAEGRNRIKEIRNQWRTEEANLVSSPINLESSDIDLLKQLFLLQDCNLQVREITCKSFIDGLNLSTEQKNTFNNLLNDIPGIIQKFEHNDRLRFVRSEGKDEKDELIKPQEDPEFKAFVLKKIEEGCKQSQVFQEVIISFLAMIEDKNTPYLKDSGIDISPCISIVKETNFKGARTDSKGNIFLDELGSFSHRTFFSETDREIPRRGYFAFSEDLLHAIFHEFIHRIMFFEPYIDPNINAFELIEAQLFNWTWNKNDFINVMQTWLKKSIEENFGTSFTSADISKIKKFHADSLRIILPKLVNLDANAEFWTIDPNKRNDWFDKNIKGIESSKYLSEYRLNPRAYSAFMFTGNPSELLAIMGLMLLKTGDNEYTLYVNKMSDIARSIDLMTPIRMDHSMFHSESEILYSDIFATVNEGIKPYRKRQLDIIDFFSAHGRLLSVPTEEGGALCHFPQQMYEIMFKLLGKDFNSYSEKMFHEKSSQMQQNPGEMLANKNDDELFEFIGISNADDYIDSLCKKF